jgi:ADP-ribose pyrophosphatase YjhB (NUDIX family)
MNELQQVYKNLYSEKGNRPYPLEKYKFCPQCGNKFLQCDANEITSIQCSNCQHIIYSNPLPAVVVLIEYEDKILLGKRNGYFGKGKWCIPGGAIEYHEDFISAAYREIKEETGLDNNNIEIVSILNVVSNFIAPQRHVLSVVLLAKFISGNPTPADDLDELHWYSLNEPLPEMFLPAEVNLIEYYASSKSNGIVISR